MRLAGPAPLGRLAVVFGALVVLLVSCRTRAWLASSSSPSSSLRSPPRSLPPPASSSSSSSSSTARHCGFLAPRTATSREAGGAAGALAALADSGHACLVGHRVSTIPALPAAAAAAAASSEGKPKKRKGGGKIGRGGRMLLLHAFTVIGKSTRWTVAGLVGAVLLIRRDAAVVTFTAGAILNALLGKALKRIIREARPDGAVLEDPGMPSSHAMALFYMTAFLTKALTEGKGAGLPAWWPLDYVSTIVGILVYVSIASSWRVHSGLHTPAQIAVGAGVGSAVGAGWQAFCTRRLNAEVLAALARYPGSQVPLSYLAGVMVVGALTVGSVERKIAKAMRRIMAVREEQEEEEGEEGEKQD